MDANLARPSHPAGRLEFAGPGNQAHLSRLARSGRAMRLTKGVYAVDSTLPAESVAMHHRFPIIARTWPGAVLCDRTAVSGGEPVEGWMFVCHPDPGRSTDLRLPGLAVSVRMGPGPLPGDMQWPQGLAMSGAARMLVENVSVAGRPPLDRPARQAGTAAVEDRIEEMARTGGIGRVRNLLAQLDVIATRLPVGPVDLVRRRLVGVLGTWAGGESVSTRLQARLDGAPYDAHRLHMFSALADVLEQTAPIPRPALGGAHRWTWLPFFEAYFSNFIEGTEFGVEEARRIAVDGEIPAARPEDAHDVAATYRIASNPTMAAVTPSSGLELLDLLREHHALLMATRTDKRPGVFKARPNYAGGYQFVSPELLEGTLTRGFSAFEPITDPFQRAVALMLLVTECHPFDDGNGRVARLLANGALSAAGQVRVVIPTIYRNNYLAGLAGVSGGAGRGETLVSVLDFAQKWTAALDWSSFEGADRELRSVDAYLDAGVAESSGLRLRLPPSG